MPNIPNKQLHSTVPCRRCRHKLASMPRWLSSAKVRPVTHTFNRFRHLMALTMRDRQVETVRKLLAEDPVRPFPLARILHGPLQLFVPSRDVWHRVSHPGDAVRCTCFEPSLGNTPPRPTPLASNPRTLTRRPAQRLRSTFPCSPWCSLHEHCLGCLGVVPCRRLRESLGISADGSEKARPLHMTVHTTRKTELLCFGCRPSWPRRWRQ